MKKIAIISELTLDNVNYGNRLQAFALNYYINNVLGQYCESLYFRGYDDRKYTALPDLKYVLKKIIHKVKGKITPQKNNIQSRRLIRFNEFTKDNILLSNEPISKKFFSRSNFDAYIVGSDIVWSQRLFYVSRIRYLDICQEKPYLKFSYAASLGEDWIPQQNIGYIKKKLDTFEKLSVREQSTVKYLEEIGVKDVKHTLDPTFLLTIDDWRKIEKRPNMRIDDYIFTYLLGIDDGCKEIIKNIAKSMNLKIINIPNAVGDVFISSDEFADYNIEDCSPEEWLWLIHNAAYVITDSFHGIALSTIFNKKFLCLNRSYKEGKRNLNNRMYSFLDSIGEIDKLVDNYRIGNLNELRWDYKRINAILSSKIDYSKAYIRDIVDIINK